MRDITAAEKAKSDLENGINWKVLFNNAMKNSISKAHDKKYDITYFEYRDGSVAVFTGLYPGNWEPKSIYPYTCKKSVWINGI